MRHLHKRNLSPVVLVTFVLGSLQAAHADKFTFHFASSDGYDVAGTIFATSNNDGSYTANSGSVFLPTSATGFQSGTYALLPTNGFAGNDNLVFPTGNPVVDSNGMSFGTPEGYAVNLYASSPYFLSDSNNNGISGTLTFQSAIIPELSSAFGFGSVLALSGLSLIRRRRRATDH